MEDFNSASMDSGATTESGSFEPAAAVGGDVAGMDTSVASPATSTDAATSDTSIDVGWSWDENDGEPASEEEGDPDADIEALTQDPSLDPARVPGLVQALRSARTAERERAKAVKQYETQFEAYGGVEGAIQSLNLVNTLFSGQPQGAAEFLTALYDNAQPVYAQVVDDVIKYNPDYAIHQLQQMGKLPADLGSLASTSSGLDEASLASIPAHLRDTAKALPSSVMDDLMLQSEEVRNYHLEREMRMQQLDQAQRQQAEQQYQQQYQQAQVSGYQAVTSLTQQYEQAQLAQLAKWQPYGPGEENAARNQMVYGEVLEGAMAQVLGDVKFAQMYKDAADLIANAPMRRLQGERLAADQDERKGRQMAAQFNAKVGQVLRERVRERNEVYKGYRAYLQMSGQTPARREISGSTMATGSSKGALGPDGKASREFLESLAQQIQLPS